MSIKKILFLGGAYSQIPIIREAKNRGWYIITCDYLPDNPGHKLADEYYNVSTTDFEGVLDLAKKVKPDFVVAYASDPAAPTAAWVSEQLGLPGNSYNSVQLLSEKDLFRKFLAENGFNTPRAIGLRNGDDLAVLKDLSFPIIVKPTDSSGSKGVSRVEDFEQAKEAIQSAFSFSRNNRIIAEEYIKSDGAQLHGDGFVVDGELVFYYLGDHHYCKQINPFVPYSTTWPSEKPKEIISRIERELKKALALSGFKNGAINIEVRVSETGQVFIMEIGPRSGGNFVPQAIHYATGFDMVGALLDVLSGTMVKIPKKENLFSAYYVIHSGKSGELNRLEIATELRPYIKEFHQYIQPGEKVSSFQGANAAIGVLILLFENGNEMNYYINNMKSFVQMEIE